jgi:hypothetical protein
LIRRHCCGLACAGTLYSVFCMTDVGHFDDVTGERHGVVAVMQKRDPEFKGK